MRRILLTLLFLSPLTPAGAANLSVKAGGGFSIPTNTPNKYSTNLLSASFNGLLGAGLDFPDGLSPFVSGELYIPFRNSSSQPVNRIWSFMANCQYRLGSSGPLKPYFIAGLGMDFFGFQGYSYQNFFALQGGFGSELELERDVQFFVEAKEHVDFPDATGYTGAYNFLPVQFGLKFEAGELVSPKEISTVIPSSSNPSPVPLKDFFIKTGGGFLSPDGYYYLYGPYSTGFVTSVAAGLEFQDHFSFFASMDAYPFDWTFLANVQYTVPLSRYLRPYLNFGIGMDLHNSSSVPSPGYGVQLGIGLEAGLPKGFNLFFETRRTDIRESLAGNYNSSEYYSTFLGGLKLYSSPSNASTETGGLPSGSPAENAFILMGGGIDFPAQNWQTAYVLGRGDVFSLGYEFSGGFAVQLDIQDFYYSGTSYLGVISNNEVLALPTLRYLAGEGFIRPYLLAGAGVELEYSTSQLGSVSVANLDLVAGAGVEFQLEGRNAVFVEGKYNFILADGVTGQDFPILAGVRLGL